MLDQYRRIKREHQEDILFFRLGDFYEMFSDDAVEVSALLNLTLTKRNGLPMCGIPYHAARVYIARLLKYGKKIAICEQLSEPTKGRGVIERKVVEIITPGTTIDEDYLDKGSSNYLAALSSTAKYISFAYIDISTGDFYATSFPLERAVGNLRLELERLQIREMVIQESLLEGDAQIGQAIKDQPSLVLNRWADWLFDRMRSRERLEKQFGAPSLKGFGLSEHSPETLSAGALLDYLDDTAKTLIPHVRHITLYGDNEYMGIDEATQRNLELVRNLRDGEINFSLLSVMDETRTAMGRRLLKRRILHPLKDLLRITIRLDMVETLYHSQEQLSVFRELLGRMPDLERLCSRLAMDKAHGKDLVALRNALISFEGAEELIHGLNLVFEGRGAVSSITTTEDQFGEDSKEKLRELRMLLERSIAEDPSILLTEGNLIRDGYSKELDELRGLKDNGRELLEAYLEEERLKTGIPSLKIRYNRLIGYFFEITKVHLSKTPAHFIRRQGVAGGERFTTDRLAALESDINGASDKIFDLEKKLFLEIREKAKALIPELSTAARRVAELDTAQSLARSATVQGWVRPAVDNKNRLRIIEGRHPVVEANLNRGEFIPNDTDLSCDRVAFALITGPNMAGKSTYLRQTALITIMAQMGSFVPAREAEIGVADRIYCRVGASDNLARGESTFLMEMNETAYILHTATEQSLVIMDEVGRGTGTEDGLSIAWAVSEELLNNTKCRTLFATHYHELANIAHSRMKNFSMEVLEREGEIVFLRKLKEGAAENSYGIHVARLAGLPDRVIFRSAAIMKKLSESGKTPHTGAELGPAGTEAPPGDPDDGEYGKFLEELASLDPDKLSPIEALNLLYSWKRLFSSKPWANRPLPPAPRPPAAKEPGKAPPRDQAGNLRGAPRLGPHDSQDEPSLFD
ncbi:MAG: DNA mismatch repair protein MutS [Treponema sp.]|jgi:DNA mismatch repair protein MutS|nr:DNA mismatch repair protein MutS [Treponema sp.]